MARLRRRRLRRAGVGASPGRAEGRVGLGPWGELCSWQAGLQRRHARRGPGGDPAWPRAARGGPGAGRAGGRGGGAVRARGGQPGAVPGARRTVPCARPAASQVAMLLLLALCLGPLLCAGSLEEARSWGDTSEQVSGDVGGTQGGPGSPAAVPLCCLLWCLAAGQAPLTSPGRRKGGPPPSPATSSVPRAPRPTPVPQLLRGSSPICWSLVAGVWMVALLVELCGGPHSPAEADLGSCNLRGFLLS